MAQEPKEIVTYSILQPDCIKRGEPFQIDVQFTVAPKWYLYAPVGTNAAQGMIETKVVFAIPQGFTRVGQTKLPKPVFKNGYEIYEGNDITITQDLLASTSLKQGRYEIKGKVTWQTCNDYICLPPVTKEIVTSIQVK